MNIMKSLRTGKRAIETENLPDFDAPQSSDSFESTEAGTGRRHASRPELVSADSREGPAGMSGRPSGNASGEVVELDIKYGESSASN